MRPHSRVRVVSPNRLGSSTGRGSEPYCSSGRTSRGPGTGSYRETCASIAQVPLVGSIKGLNPSGANDSPRYAPDAMSGWNGSAHSSVTAGLPSNHARSPYKEQNPRVVHYQTILLFMLQG